MHSLLSGNLMDVCPVGAITTRDYRFKSRPWDNPDAVDTICTLCSKGCSTTAWIKAKPEWAKGARLVRFTPRYEPAVNGYWMCDIGRFDYHWIEGDQRLHTPLVREGAGHQQTTTWDAALRALGERAAAVAGQGFTFLISAHASNEEIFLVERLASAIAVSWTVSEKPQPARTKFKVPSVNAPNVTGARDLGLPVGDGADAPISRPFGRPSKPDRSPRSTWSTRVPTDRSAMSSWVAAARQSGKLSLLVYQGVVSTELARAADIVLPGSAWVEKDGTFTNDQGRVQTRRESLLRPRAKRSTTARSSCASPGRPVSRCRTRRLPTCVRPLGNR